MTIVEPIARLESFYSDYGYPAVFLSGLIEISPLGWLVPGGLILAGGGFYSGVASLAWSSLLVIVGFLAGSEREKLEAGLAGLGILSWGLVFLAAAIIY